VQTARHVLEATRSGCLKALKGLVIVMHNAYHSFIQHSTAWWGEFVKAPVTGLVLLAIIFGALTSLIGLLLRRIRPVFAIRIKPFEVAESPPPRLSLTGNSIASYLADELLQILAKTVTVTRPDADSGVLSLPDVAVPVLSNTVRAPEIDVEVRGFSLAAILSLWRLLRQHEHVVAGDLVCVRDEIWLRVRTDAGDYWDRAVPDYEQLCRVCREVACKIMERFCPPVMGALYAAEVGNDRALSLYREWASREPNNFQAHFYLGAQLIQAETGGEEPDSPGLALGPRVKDEARSCFRKALQLNPKSPDVLFALGVLAEKEPTRSSSEANEADRKKAVREAEAAYRLAIRRRPNYVLALSRLGALLLDDGRWAEALPLLKKANKIRPNFPKVLANLADAYVKAGQYEDGIRCYELAMRLNA